MKIDPDVCISCEECVPYCPVGAISVDDVAQIDLEECVECGVCIRSGACTVDAFIDGIHPWPRALRAVFSNPLLEHKVTRVPGRGTEEMKTNDVRGIYGNGIIGITAELGRPVTGTRFRDVEKVAQAMARGGVKFADDNPVTHLMTDRNTGKIDPQVYDEKVLSAMVEGLLPLEKLPHVINEIKAVAPKIDTVFSLDLIDRPESDGSSAALRMLEKLGVSVYINGKNNLGLGRPLAKEIE